MRRDQARPDYGREGGNALQRPIQYDRPLGLCIGEGAGDVRAHSYQTFVELVHLQKWADTLSPALRTTGVRSGMNKGNQLNMPCHNKKGERAVRVDVKGRGAIRLNMLYFRPYCFHTFFLFGAPFFEFAVKRYNAM